MRLINDAEVAEVITMREAVVVMAAAFEQFGNGAGSIAPRVRATAELGVRSSSVAAMGAALPASGVVGAKVYSTVGGRFNFVIVLFSSLTGEALASIEANEITKFRTAAASAVAMRRLWRRERRARWRSSVPACRRDPMPKHCCSRIRWSACWWPAVRRRPNSRTGCRPNSASSRRRSMRSPPRTKPM
jgi:hypothetical protein